MAFITGTSHYVPPRVVANEDLTQFPEQFRNLIAQKAGILSRRHVDSECTSDLGASAVRLLLEKTGVEPGSIQALICATSSPDRMQPATATRIQDLSGLNNAFAFDVNSVCTGAIYALRLAAALVHDGLERVVVVASEVYSKILNPNDIATYPYFGDGAAAALVTRTGAMEMTEFILHSDGSGCDVIQVPGGGTMMPGPTVEKPRDFYFTMVGRQVYEFAREKGTVLIQELSSRSGGTADRIITHQANRMPIGEIAVKSGEPVEKFVVNVDRYGNTAGASVLIGLDESLTEHPDDRSIILAAFGGGLSWGGILLKR